MTILRKSVQDRESLTIQIVLHGRYQLYDRQSILRVFINHVINLQVLCCSNATSGTSKTIESSVIIRWLRSESCWKTLNTGSVFFQADKTLHFEVYLRRWTLLNPYKQKLVEKWGVYHTTWLKCIKIFQRRRMFALHTRQTRFSTRFNGCA